MAKIKYKNKATGIEFSGDAKDVDRLKKHPKLGGLYIYEAEAEKPAEPKTTKTATVPAETKEHESK